MNSSVSPSNTSVATAINGLSSNTTPVSASPTTSDTDDNSVCSVGSVGSVGSVSTICASSITLPMVTIHVSTFSPKTWNEWKMATSKSFGSSTNIKSWKAGDYVVCTCNKKLVLIAKLKGVCTLRDLLDVEIYSGTDTKYNKYEFPISCYWIIPEPIPFESVAEICGVSVKIPIYNNLFRGVPMQRSEAFYGLKGQSSLVLDRYHGLIARLIVGLTPVIV